MSSSTVRHLVVPFEGVDDVRFGMTPQEVADVAGDAEDVREDPILEAITERRGATEHIFEDGVLSEIVVYRPGRGAAIREQLGGAGYEPVLVGDIEILDRSGFATLCARERMQEGRGGHSTLFPDIGILVTGFGKRVPEGAYVAVFPRGSLGRFATMLEV
ncbi:hypothetical protein [Microbacterium sp. gxy059]|uniref:hypothetical protein n=1 Tax=Microbacterium sp. gxy059 TaxID=2957199 RepID=UPI003D97111A